MEPKKPEKGGAPEDSAEPTPNVTEVLQPFQEASAKFLKARRAAQEAALQQQVQACLDLRQRVWEVEQEAYRAMFAAAKAHVSKLGASSGDEEQGLAVAQSHLEYEIKARQVDFDTRLKLKSLTEESLTEKSADVAQQFTTRQQEAYQAYLADLQKAWSTAKGLDPQSTSAIASHIMFAMSGAV
jgi:hypothetical protein